MSKLLSKGHRPESVTQDSENAGALNELLSIMRQLRDPVAGCEWDKQQTFASISPYTIEEAYEVADAIDKGNIFPDKNGETILPQKGQWEQIKAQERLSAGINRDDSILANVPLGMSPLLRAQKLQQKCAKAGFDWDALSPVLDKLQEEIEEVMAEVNAPDPSQAAIEDEIGDVLFSVVNLARHVKVDAQSALRKASTKFEQRFRLVESLVRAQGQSVKDCALSELEAFWQQAKKQ